MSEVNTKTEDRKPYKVEVDPIEFEASYSGLFMSSLDFCKLTNEYFRAAFGDYVGSTFDMTQSGPMISLYFSHLKDVNGIRACDRITSKTTGSTILDRTRGRDLQMKEGDRFHITDDGIDIIKPLLASRYFNQGKPNWKNIVVDIVDNNAQSYYQPQNVTHLTKIIGIDPRNICALIYGTKDSEGNYIDYGIDVKADLSIRSGLIPGQQQSNYALAITKAYSGTIAKTYEKLGIGFAGGSNIVR